MDVRNERQFKGNFERKGDSLRKNVKDRENGLRKDIKGKGET